jgi:uncharacterized protein (UPF0262 family)
MNDAAKGRSALCRIIDITLDEGTVARRSPEVQHERAVAIYDLLEDNSFEPVGCGTGPYRLRLAMEDMSRLVFDIRDEAGEALGRVKLPLLPFRRIVKQYFQVCESYYEAIRHAPPSRIEAIDMGRRGLHDEGSALLRERLAGLIAVDHATARRLFTLICVLHIRG